MLAIILAAFVATAWGSGGSAGTNCYGTIDSLHPTGMHSGGIEPAVIAALASRESNGGDALASDGTGDRGHAWGILQCDFTHSGLACKSCPAKSCCHIKMMVTQLLIPYIKRVATNHRSWPKAHQLQGGVAAYNFGVGNVQSWGGLDVGSTGNDYSNDVMARAQYLKSHYGYV
ncbi:hypothetical protein BaRGS_00035966 [Batillaria attramentaria]|uniref:Lysozyme g n=1 Tax=Batillaria attramentaria TaxID=370345 RepID=A0ABD0JDC4_9CAEN